MNRVSPTTAIGFGLAGLQAATLDYDKLASGNKSEWLRVGFIFMFGLWGYFQADRNDSNKTGENPPANPKEK